MPSADPLAVIRSEGERILTLAREDRARPVPQYRGWVMGDLALHVAAVLGRTTLICRERPTERPSAPRPPDQVDVLDWYESNLSEMLATLEESDPDTQVWGFWPDPCIGLWQRRMVIETGLHRWDADQAFGDPGPLHELVTLAGLEEFGDMWLSRAGELPALELSAVDLGRSWVYGVGNPVETVSGTASDLYLRLMSRPSSVDLPDEWATALDGLAPPPKP